MAIQCGNCNRELSAQQAALPCPQCGMSAEDRAAIDTEKSRVAQFLAERHYESESGLTRIIRLRGSAEGPPVEPIKLLEVNESTFASGINPLQFGAAPANGVMFPSVILEVTPEEFVKIQTQELKLPRGWILGEDLPRPAVAGGV